MPNKEFSGHIDREFLKDVDINLILTELAKRELSPADITALQYVIDSQKDNTEGRPGTSSRKTTEVKPQEKIEKPQNNKALIRAIEQENMFAFEMLLSHDTINIPDEHGTTPLIAAVKTKNKFFITRVLGFHPDISATDNQNETAMSYAVKNKDIFTITLLTQL